MDAIAVAHLVAAALEREPGCERVQGFEDAGIVSSAEGLVVSMGGGDEFRISVVQTRYAPTSRARLFTRRAS